MKWTAVQVLFVLLGGAWGFAVFTELFITWYSGTDLAPRLRILLGIEAAVVLLAVVVVAFNFVYFRMKSP